MLTTLHHKNISMLYIATVHCQQRLKVYLFFGKIESVEFEVIGTCKRNLFRFILETLMRVYLNILIFYIMILQEILRYRKLFHIDSVKNKPKTQKMKKNA